MTVPIGVGFIAIARTTFDIPLAEHMTAQARAQLEAAGFTLFGPEALVTNAEEAEAAVGSLTEYSPPLVIMFQATFADSTMVTSIAQAVNAPLLMWAVPEERTGGRLRLNSLCGINLAAHALKRAGYFYEHVYAAPGDAVVVQKALALRGASVARHWLQGARIGRVGENPAGFETCNFDASALKERFGVNIVQLDLGSVFEVSRQIEPDTIQLTRGELAERVSGLESVDQTALDGTLSVYWTLRTLAHTQNLEGFAVRCWPEFFTERGCAACGAMSMMNDGGVPCSCEADVNGTITQYILQSISGEPAFGTDVVAVDDERDGLVLWHCGLAPLSMADPESQPVAAIHSNRKLPLLMEFPLKPGRVTVARLSEVGGEYRLVVGAGEMQRAPKSFSGTSGVVKFDRPAAEVLDTLLSEGLEHHLSLTYGDHTNALYTLAKMLELPVLRL